MKKKEYRPFKSIFTILFTSKFQINVLYKAQTSDPANGDAILQNVSLFHGTNSMAFVSFFLSFRSLRNSIQRKRIEKWSVSMETKEQIYCAFNLFAIFVLIVSLFLFPSLSFRLSWNGYIRIKELKETVSRMDWIKTKSDRYLARSSKQQTRREKKIKSFFPG